MMITIILLDLVGVVISVTKKDMEQQHPMG